MPFNNPYYKERTITGGAGANDTFMAQVFFNGPFIDSVTHSFNSPGFSDSSDNYGQGVVGNAAGTVYWASTSFKLFRFTRSGNVLTLDISRSVSGDDPTSKTQINGLSLSADESTLIVSAHNTTGGANDAWRLEYNATTLVHEDTLLLGNKHVCEGVHDRTPDQIFAAGHGDSNVYRYNASGVLQQTYDLSSQVLLQSRVGESGWWQNISWYGDIAVMAMHGSGVYTGSPRVEGYQYRPTTDDFHRVFSLPTPALTGSYAQQQAWVDLARSEMVICGRGSSDHTLQFFNINWIDGFDLEGDAGQVSMNDVVLAAEDETPMCGHNNTGYRETHVPECHLRLWGKHPNAAGASRRLRIYYGDANRLFSESGIDFDGGGEDFESGVGSLTESFGGGAISIDTDPVFQGSQSIELTTSPGNTGGVYSPEGTFIDANQKRVIFYVRPSPSAISTAKSQTWIQKLVSGSTVRRSGLRFWNTGFEVRHAGSYQSISSSNLLGRWLRVEAQYDYDADTIVWKVMLPEGMVWAEYTATMDDTSVGYRDFLVYGPTGAHWDQVFSVGSYAAGAFPTLGTVGSREDAPATPVSSGGNYILGGRNTMRPGRGPVKAA